MAKRTKEEEEKRLTALWETEFGLIREGYKTIAGADEAGRGPLAGPVFAAAVILPRGALVEGVDDSKKLSPKKREEVYKRIIDTAESWACADVDEKIIDEINILNAVHLAMKNAVKSLSVEPDYVLIDGNSAPDMEFKCGTLVKGDSKSINIAAASIIAKVERDRYISRMAEQYPEYGFERHKGYGTKQHVEAILKYGPSPIHRRTFLRKILK